MFCISSRLPATLAALAILAGCAKHYKAQGIVLAVDRAGRTVTISHRAIPHYMEAMTMPFQAGPAEDLTRLAPGSRIDFQLRVSHASTSVRRIRVQQTKLDDIPLPKPEGKIAVGDAAPDFSLTDQDARAIKLSDFRGQVVALDFIYTRCPMPDVCPRLSANFARLQKRYASKIVLLSITLDPEYDTPAVLTDYAHRWRADPHTWRFLTGAPEEIRKIAGHFGVIYWPEEGTLTHTASTAIIDRTGKLAALVEGSSFTSQQLLDLVATFLPAP